MSNVQVIDETELVASICRDSFSEFVREFWDTIVTDKLHWNWHMEYLCEQLQELAERVIAGKAKTHDLVANVPPGSSKSSIASIFFPAWVWTRMPHAQFICGSYSEALALDLSRKCRLVVGSDKYRKYFPDIEWSDAQDSKHHFVNTKQGWRLAVGAGGTITGLHAHFIIIDDPLNPRQAVSELELSKSLRWLSETVYSRCVDASVTAIALIMQRLHQNDPTAQMLGYRNVRHICLPATSDYPVLPIELKERYINGLLDPKRLPAHVLQSYQERLGQFAYAGQYGQQPIPLGGGMFMVDKLVDQVPLSPIKEVVRFWDKAATHGGGAYSAGVKLARTMDGKYAILDVVRKQVDSATREELIKWTAYQDGHGVLIGIEQEGGSGGKQSAQETVANLAGYRVIVVVPQGNKALRADPFSSQVNAGNVYICKGPWNQAFIEEMQYFPHGKFLDQIDAASGAFSLLAQRRRRIGAIRPKDKQ